MRDRAEANATNDRAFWTFLGVILLGCAGVGVFFALVGRFYPCDTQDCGTESWQATVQLICAIAGFVSVALGIHYGRQSMQLRATVWVSMAILLFVAWGLFFDHVVRG